MNGAEDLVTMERTPIALPRNAGPWTRSQDTLRMAPGMLFQYMDGAGELYLGYRFEFLDAWRYENPVEDGILVEIYQMRSSDDAFGLLSTDWGGIPVFGPGAGGPRALYGAGLLRIWSGDVFARVLAHRETEQSRDAVLALGRAVLSQRAGAAAPALVRALPGEVDRYRLEAGSVTFLRSHLVLNSVYFLSPENLLNLDARCELAAALYTPTEGASSETHVRLFVARYQDAQASVAALRHFLTAYLPEHRFPGAEGSAAVEDGWIAFRRSGRAFALVFECDDAESARFVASVAMDSLTALERADA